MHNEILVAAAMTSLAGDDVCRQRGPESQREQLEKLNLEHIEY